MPTERANTREKWNALRPAKRGEIADFDRLRQMVENIIPDPLKHLTAQPAAHGSIGDRRMAGHHMFDKATCRLVPEPGAVRISVCALGRQQTRGAEKFSIVTRHAFVEPRVEGGILGRRERQLLGRNGDHKHVDAAIGFSRAIHAGRTDRERAGIDLMPKRPPGHAALHPQPRRHLEEDQMLARRRAEMRRGFKPRLQQADAAFEPEDVLRSTSGAGCHPSGSNAFH